MNGLVGNSGSYSQQGLLDLALRLQCSGTLVLRFEAGTRLLLLEGGRIGSSFDLAEPGDQGDIALDFRFEAHGASELPQLSCSFPDSAVGLLRALPLLGPSQHLPPGVSDLRSLVARVKAEGYSGVLSVQSEDELGAALFFDGRIGAAFFEKDGHVWEHGDALRGMYRYSLESGREPMMLQRLEGQLVRSLLGLAHERRVGGGDPQSFSGISCGEGGYTFYCDGRPYLHVVARHSGPGGRFAPLEAIPNFELPDDPPGWERRRFDLTLRGRDALNPMTELSMEFGENYGDGGRRILEAVRRGLSIEEMSARLEIDLQTIKPWLERLESDGLIRQRR